MLPKLSFILGGAASGKSAFAESLVNQTNAPKVYLATAQIFDDEMRKKVDAHIAMRGPNWITIQEPLTLATALAELTSEQVVLLDCATMWLTNLLLAEQDIAKAIDALIDSLEMCPARVVIVSNEVGMGIVPENALARQFRDLQGRLNQRLAAQANLAVFVIAGVPMVLKGKLP